MAATDSAKREQLFDLYAKNLSFFSVDPPGIFICPLCLRGFQRGALSAPYPVLTLAHVIPRSMGGTFCTLTCVDCNNSGGSGIEAALLRRFAAEDCMAGAKKQPARLSGPFGTIGVTFTYQPQGNVWSMFPVEKQSHPDHIRAYRSYMEGAGRGSLEDFRVSLGVPYRHQPKRVAAAIYQSAFLLLFAFFGYEFLFHPHFAFLREKLTRPDDVDWTTRISILSDSSAQNLLSDRPYTVMLLREPVSAILVALRLCPTEGRDRNFALLLPGLDSPTIPETELTTFSGSTIPYKPEELRNGNDFLRVAWQYSRQPVTGE